MFYKHESIALQEIFKRKPYQGTDPAKAKFLFIGLDANYHPQIDKSPIFGELIKYLDDGPSFWRRNQIHHPFLLNAYRGDGRKYHQSFSRIGFTSKNADEVSFAELIDVPTHNRSQLTAQDLNRSHLERLNEWIVGGSSKYVFIPTSVGNLMRESRAFKWIPQAPTQGTGHLRHWANLNGKQIFWHYHFSVYGKFEEGKTQQFSEIRKLISE
jgi:hypothetical protein